MGRQRALIEPQHIAALTLCIAMQSRVNWNAPAHERLRLCFLFANAQRLAHFQNDRTVITDKARIMRELRIGMIRQQRIMEQHLGAGIAQQLRERVVFLLRGSKVNRRTVMPALRISGGDGRIGAAHKHTPQRCHHTLAAVKRKAHGRIV